MRRLCLILAALWFSLLALPASAQWQPSGYYRSENQLSDTDDFDDATKGVHQVIVAQLFDPDFGLLGTATRPPFSILGERYTQLVYDDDPWVRGGLFDKYLQRWQRQRNDGRPASEFCAGFLRFLETVPHEKDAIGR